MILPYIEGSEGASIAASREGSVSKTTKAIEVDSISAMTSASTS